MQDTSERSPWQADFPRAKILNTPHDVQQHKDYQAAKAGDPEAAYRLVRDTVSENDLSLIAKAVGNRKPIVVSVHAEERAGRNKIPVMMAERVAYNLDYDLDDVIVQAEKVSRGGSSGFHRLANSPRFIGPVEAGRDYVIVDDTLTQGGTIAALKGYIESRGGRVILASALMGKQYSATLAPTKGMLQEVRERYGEDFDGWWHEHFGYGLDQLTQSELRYLAKVSRPESVRDRILAARQARGDSGSSSDEGGGEGRRPARRPQLIDSRATLKNRAAIGPGCFGATDQALGWGTAGLHGR